VGGGIVGTSIAYHLAKHGCKDVVLLERDQVTSGTTWHAAGLMVTFGSLSETSTELRKYSKELYRDVLEKETGQSTGFKPCGFIELATNEDRLQEFRRVAAFNRKCGIDVHEIEPSEVKRLFPACDVEDVIAGFYVSDDGRVNPYDACMAMAKGAKLRGVRILERTSAVGFTKTADGRRVTGVKVRSGEDSEEQTIRARVVVNACGMWARQIGEMAGVVVPNQAAEHYYLVTDPIENVDPDWPVIEDPSSYTYIRPEGGGLMIGLFETKAAAWNVGRIPGDFSFGEIQPDWDRMAPFLEAAMSRVPASLDAGMKNFFCGPESFTPDLNPILGESPELENFFVAAGMNSIGILTGAGIGNLMSQWIMHGRVDEYDVTGMNIDRFSLGRATTNPKYRSERVVESLGRVYQLHYPNRSFKTARGAKRSPLHERLREHGAHFREVSGWEAADWYGIDGLDYDPANDADLSWGREVWFDRWEQEHRACRSDVILMDMSFMSKFVVRGDGAGQMLNRLSTANVDDEMGRITYCQWLNASGKMEADLTVAKLDNETTTIFGDAVSGVASSYLVVATDTAHRHVQSWMARGGGERRSESNDRRDWSISDVTGTLAQINVQGPRSRELLSRVADVEMDDTSFAFRTCREIGIDFARVLCARITYVGELGYELYVPVESAVHVYDALVDAGKDLGLRHAGLKALSSLRMEKAYRDYGHDMDNTDSLLEVGLGFTADTSKPGGFIGKEPFEAQRACKSLSKRMVQVLLRDPEPLMHHGEIVYRDGAIVGDIRAASYGHTLGGAVGLSMIESDGRITKRWLDEGEWEVDVAGVRYPAEVSLRPMYDPKNDRIKA